MPKDSEGSTGSSYIVDRKKKMDCKQVQSGIIDFINDNMDIKEMEQFISHIENCEECREEYDVYYTLIMGMKLLDSDNLRGKTQIDSQDRIDDAKSYILRYCLKRFFFLYLYV